jgi:hypothetical protein
MFHQLKLPKKESTPRKERAKHRRAKVKRQRVDGAIHLLQSNGYFVQKRGEIRLT